ncbi:MAG: hypothetical protein LCH62_21175 [Proteobacteria bacterium]|nr:hypothetical protein [Pseudomonadota bacterium]
MAYKWRLARLYLADRWTRRRYRRINEADLVGKRRSDTVFVFGTGASLLDVTAAQWAAIARHDVVSFREFHRQSFVRVDYHVTGEIDDVDDYARSLRDNPLYADCLYLIQEGWRAERGNELVGRGLLPAGTRMMRYHRRARGVYAPPSRNFGDGIVHGYGSICGVTNICLLLGWKHIVLCGIDLYDHRHFYMPPDTTRAVEKDGLTYSDPYVTARPIVDLIGDWADLVRPEGVRIETWNPKSMLAARIPAFDRTILTS